MTQANILSTGDKFNRQRALMVARYYRPTLYPILLLVAGGSIMTAILMALTKVSFIFPLISSAVSLVTSLIAYLSPLTLCRSRKPVIETLMPATACEKIIVLGTFFIVILPMILQLPSWLCSGEVMKNLPFVSGKNVVLMDSIGRSRYVIGLFNTMGPAAMCLFSVIAWPGRKTKAVLCTLGLLFVLFTCGGIAGGLFAFKLGYEDAVAGLSPQSSEEIAVQFVGMLENMLVYISIGMLTVTVLLWWGGYKKLKNRQF